MVLTLFESEHVIIRTACCVGNDVLILPFGGWEQYVV